MYIITCRQHLPCTLSFHRLSSDFITVPEETTETQALAALRRGGQAT